MKANVQRVFDEQPISEEQRARLIKVWQECCHALQTVVADLKISQDELKFAGQFFNRLGQSGMFPSLLAVGLSMTSLRVTEGNDGTPPNIEGPYYQKNAPIRDDGVLYEKRPGANARYLDLSGVVIDSETRQPLQGVELDLWQADENGTYDNIGNHLRGRVFSDAEGRYRVKSVVPKDYSEHDHDPIGELFSAMGRHNRRAAHIHLKVRRPGYIPLTTQLYMPDGNYLNDDYVEGAVIPELIVNFDKGETDEWKVSARFDLAITPEGARVR
jgi:protocatechuate 3,4-dioxygenase beta subunit